MAAARPTEDSKSLLQRLASANQEAWLSLGRIADMMGDDQNTMIAYEKVLSHNRMNATALSAIGCVYEKMEDYTKAADCFRGLVSLNEQNSDAWGHLGYCCLMMNDLTSAHTAYQYAMYNNPTSQKDPNMWYGIGQLYERLGSLEHAQESFEAVLRFEPNFNMALEVKFRLGIIAKQRGDYDGALESLKSVLHDVQTNVQTTDMASDIWTQIGHVYELKEEIQLAKSSYLKVAELNPNNAKPLQQLGWLCLKHSEHAPAIDYLKKAVALDPQDGKGWYLLGRCYMAVHEFEEAYDSYKHAVTTDPQNPNVWCSLGVLFYQLNQHLDALDAYSRAININPNICEVWYNIGTLYDTCNQTSDARDAYQKAAELGADAQFIRERLDLLRARETGQPTMGMAGANSAPGPSEPPTTSPMPTFTSRPTPETAAPRAASPAQREGSAGATDAATRVTPCRSSVHQMLRGEHALGDSRGVGAGVAALQSAISATSGAMGATRGNSVVSNVPVRMGPDGRGMLPRGMVGGVGGANMPPLQQQQQHFHHQPPQLSLPAQQQQQQRHAAPPMASHLQHRAQQLPQNQSRHPGQQMHLQHPAQAGHAHPMQQQQQQQQQADRREMASRMMHDERASGVRHAMESGRGAMGPPPTQRLGSFGAKPMGPPGAHTGGPLTPAHQQQQQQQPRGVERFPMPMGNGDATQMRHPASMAMPSVRR